MKTESDFMVNLLLEFKRRNITALPIHDGVVVTASKTSEAKQLMLNFFEQEIGVTAEVTIETEASGIWREKRMLCVSLSSA